MKKSCDTCEFQFYGKNGICAGKEYGKPMKEVKKIHPNGCEEWGISFEAYCKEESKKLRKQKNEMS